MAELEVIEINIGDSLDRLDQPVKPPLRTSPQPTSRTSEESTGWSLGEHNDISWRHGGWTVRRKRLLESLNRTNQLSRFDRVSSCGARSYVYKHDETGEIRIKGSYCHDKLCVPCATGRAQIIGENVCTKLKSITGKLSHVVLTLKHGDTSLKEQLTRLYKHWDKLRNSKWFKDRISGGFVTLEITRSKSNHWHPHLHMIVENLPTARFTTEDLQTQWIVITNGSSEVDVSTIQTAPQAAYIISRYLTKPLSASVFHHPDSLDEYTLATAGKRTVSTFGTWRGLSLTKADRQPINNETWTCLGKLGTVLARGLYDPSLKHVRRQLDNMRTIYSRPPPRPIEAF